MSGGSRGLAKFVQSTYIQGKPQRTYGIHWVYGFPSGAHNDVVVGPVADISADISIDALVADLELGLSCARLAARADDHWFASRNRAKARQAYAAVLQMKERLAEALNDHADVMRQIEELRLASQAA